MNRWSLVPLTIAGLTFAGCGTVWVGKPSIDFEAARARTAGVDVKSMTRADVHALLGAPWLASDPFGVEVYRLQGTQRFIDFFMVIPVPTSGTLEVYSLVTYSTDGRVSGTASDFVPTAGRTIVLRAGGFEFVHGEPVLNRLRDTLSVSLERWLEVRATRPAPTTCTLLVDGDRAHLAALGEGGTCNCTSKLSVDGAKQRNVRVMELSINQSDTRSSCQNVGGFFHPIWDPESGSCSLTLGALVPLTLPAGTHQLHFTAGFYADATTTLDCHAGELTFATLGGTFTRCDSLKSPGHSDHGTPATVALSPQAPASDGEPRVFIYDDGTWLYPATSVAP